MRRSALRLSAGVLLATIVVALFAREPAQPATAQTVTLEPSFEIRMYGVKKGTMPGQISGYWGRLTGEVKGNKTESEHGSYRATCVWLGEKPGEKDHDRLECTLLLNLAWGALVLRGLMGSPEADDRLLLRGSWAQTLAVVGGTNRYSGARGFVEYTKPKLTARLL